MIREIIPGSPVEYTAFGFNLRICARAAMVDVDIALHHACTRYKLDPALTGDAKKLALGEAMKALDYWEEVIEQSRHVAANIVSQILIMEAASVVDEKSE